MKKTQKIKNVKKMPIKSFKIEFFGTLYKLCIKKAMFYNKFKQFISIFYLQMHSYYSHTNSCALIIYYLYLYNTYALFR